MNQTNKQNTMRNFFFLLIGITFSQLAIAQNPYLTDYKYAWKVNNLSTLSSSNIIVFGSNPYATNIVKDNRLSKQIQLLHPTFAFDWQSKRKNTHELELIDLILNRASIKNYPSPGNNAFSDRTVQTAISFRYEYKINFCTNKESRWVPSLGFSVTPYYQHTRSALSDSSVSYQTGSEVMGIRAAFNPSITYFFNKRFFITAGFSLTMIDFSRSTYLNPASVQRSLEKRTFYNAKTLSELLEFR